ALGAADVGGPPVRDAQALPLRAGREHGRQVRLGGALAVEGGRVEDAAVAAVERAAFQVAVVDGVVEVARVVVGGDQVDPGAVGGVAGVAVDVADLGPGEELARVAPRLALVVRDEGALVVVDRSREAVQAAVHGVEVGVGDAPAAGQGAPVEGALGAPSGGVAGFADAPTRQIVGLVLGVHGQPAAVRAPPQGRDVVVVGF